MDRSASVYARQNKIIVTSMSRTVVGFWAGNGQYQILPADASDDQLGAAALEALTESRHNAPVPDPDGPSLLLPVLRELHIGTYDEFARSAELVGIWRTGEDLTVTPYRNDGPKGFTEIDEHTAVVTPQTSVNLGAAIRAAFQMLT